MGKNKLNLNPIEKKMSAHSMLQPSCTIIKKAVFVFYVLILFTINSNAQSHRSCEKLPNSFPNHESATQQITSAEFKINETIDTRKSSWIRGLTFLSCDGKSGFMLMKTGNKSYIHQNVPKEIWDELKSADSFGTYYNENIKHRYQISIK